nr:helix-turn-helix transcriptional regulator [Candidatus Promineifilum breve]
MNILYTSFSILSIGNLLIRVYSLFTIVWFTSNIVDMGKIQFRIRELMAERSRLTGQPVTYDLITQATGISSNTLSLLARGKSSMVGISVIERLIDYFACDVAHLIVYVPATPQDEQPD